MRPASQQARPAAWSAERTADAGHRGRRGRGLAADGLQRAEQPRAAASRRPSTRVQPVIDQLGYSPNRAARQLRTRASHLIGLRFEPAQEGTSNALMDRFLHSLVDAASRTGHHLLLFSGDDPEDPLDGYDDLLRSTAVDAFVVTDTYAGTPQSSFLQDRDAPVRRLRPPVGRPAGRPRLGRRRRCARRPHRHRAPARAGPPPGGLAGLGAHLPDRPGPPLGLGERAACRGPRHRPGSAYA